MDRLEHTVAVTGIHVPVQLANSVRSQRLLEGLRERLRDHAVQKVYPVACGYKHDYLALGRPLKAQPDCTCTHRSVSTVSFFIFQGTGHNCLFCLVFTSFLPLCSINSGGKQGYSWLFSLPRGRDKTPTLETLRYTKPLNSTAAC